MAIDQRIERARRGDVAAFSALVEEHQRRVRAYIAACGGGLLDQAAVDDLAQETFLDAFRSIQDYRAELPILGWFLGIARHRVLRHVRAGSRREHALGRLLREALVALIGQQEAQADGAEARRIAGLDADAGTEAALAGCLQALPERSRALVQAHYFEGRSLVSLAAEWGKREGALRVALLRIRQALRACIGQRLAARGGP